MTLLSTLYDQVRPQADLISKPAVLRHAQRYANMFFRETLAWRVTDTATMPANHAEGYWPLGTVDVDNLDHVRIQKLITVVDAQGQRIAFRSPTQLDLERPDWRNDTGTYPQGIIDTKPGFTVVPKPTSQTTITGVLALYPTLAATALPDEVFAEHEHRLLDGVLASVYAEKNRPWSDPERAAEYRAYAGAGMNDARRAAEHDQHNRGSMSYGGI